MLSIEHAFKLLKATTVHAPYVKWTLFEQLCLRTVPSYVVSYASLPEEIVYCMHADFDSIS